MHNITVCREEGRFCGWPANEGCWTFGGADGDPFEIVVGFQLAYLCHDVGTSLHRIDRNRTREHVLARSLDGGHTWTLERPVLPGDGSKNSTLTGESETATEDVDTGAPSGFDFTSPGFAMKCRGDAFYISDDRCRSWQGPWKLPAVEDRTLLARTDYVVNGPRDLTLFLTAAKQNGNEGHPYCVRTTDGGQTWSATSWIGPEPDGFAIMPSSLRLASGRLVCAVRRHEGPEDEQTNWIDLWASDDDGASWAFVTRPAPSTGIRGGNPPSMKVLRDGRIVITYGVRSEPFGIRARVSDDDGVTWSDEIMLRDDAGDRDLGYTRTVVRPDGKLVTMYYIDDKPDGERYIGGTIWEA